MTVSLGERSELLLDRLYLLASSPSTENYLCITARRQHGARSVAIDRPTLAIVLRGAKQLRGAGGLIELHQGDLFVVTRACQFDAINTPDAATGLYLTLTVPLCDEVIAAAQLLWSKPVAQGGDDIVTMRARKLEDELLAWSGAIEQGQYGEARLALAAMLIRLCQWGHTQVLVPPPPSVSAQVRALVAEKPDREWRSLDFELALGVSAATLRRRLSAEKTALRSAVTEARLSCAMELLYTTRWPIKTVAARVGYRSAATFVQRFTERYGMDPGHIGNV